MKKYFMTAATVALFAIGFAASDGSYSDDFEKLEESLPEDGSSTFVVYDQSSYGKKNRMLQLIVFYEKDDNRDIRIEGVESNGTSFSLEGKWAKGTQKETFQAKEYEYFWFWAGDDNFYVDKDMNIYYDGTGSFLDSGKEVAAAFKAGVIGKLRKCADEEDAKKELEKIRHDVKKTDKREENISLLEGEEKKMATVGYNNGQIYGQTLVVQSIGTIHIISEREDEVGDEFKEMIVELADSEYDKTYNAPSNAKEEKLKKIYVKYFIRGLNEIIKSVGN